MRLSVSSGVYSFKWLDRVIEKGGRLSKARFCSFAKEIPYQLAAGPKSYEKPPLGSTGVPACEKLGGFA
jgi:hypothetical protein